MENLYSPETADQARKTARDAQKLGADVKRDFDDAVARGKDAARGVAEDARSAPWPISERAREVAEATRKSVGKAAERFSSYADDNTALVAVAAFGVGLLAGYLVGRES
jgi:ElaB/YqjD/DUF883 family membrane-anchored ribosome-binding protein